MKIVCDNCATKYSIADEKVRGKVFKIRCKKCSHIIVVRGNENGAEANGAAGGHDAFAEESLSAASVSGTASTAPAAGGNADSVWHLVIDREQVGPMTAAEVRTKFAAGEVDVETYAWREGFGDWLRLGSIDDFRDLEAKAPAAAPPSDEGATRRTDAADLFARASAADDADANQDAGADLFGAAGASPAASPAPAAKPAAADVFAPAPASNAFAASEAAPARSARTSSPKLNPAGSDLDGGGGGGGAAGATSEQRMAGQRNENSVLFSLNNLQALASGSGGAKGGGASAAAKPGVDTRPGYANSQSEGSGLIDIRAMAASTLASSPASSSSSSSSKEEAPTFAAPPIFSPMAAPIMMPAAPTGTPKWVFAVLGVGVLAVVGIIVVGVLLLTRKPEAPPIVAVAPTTPSPTTPSPTAPTAPTVGTPAPTTPTTPTAAPAGETKTEAKGAEPAAEKKGSSSSKRDKKDKAAAKSEGATGAVVPPPSESPKPAAAPSSGKKRDAIDDLLDGASPDKGKKSAPAAEKASSSGGGEDLPDQLDKGAIVGGMSKVKGKVASCYDQFKVPGMANVAVTIAKSGTVSSASVSGAFAGTPTGSCVEKAVKSATFPKFKGAAQSINYPFILR